MNPNNEHTNPMMFAIRYKFTMQTSLVLFIIIHNASLNIVIHVSAGYFG